MPDEPPIRVRNGSMTIALGSSEWKASGQAWTPLVGTNAGGFNVIVEVATGSGIAIGQPVFGREVEISYSDGTVIRFKRGPSSKKTKVTPKRVLRKTADPVLEYGQPGEGYINGVVVKENNTSWRCAFESRDMLSEIDIDPLPHTARTNQARARRKR